MMGKLTAGCNDGVDKYWPDMSTAIFQYTETPSDICEGLGLCTKSTFTFDCETCYEMMTQLYELFKDEAFVTSLLDKVIGFLYCDTAADPTECQAFVETYGVAIMSVLGDYLVTEDVSTCDRIGCEQMKKLR